MYYLYSIFSIGDGPDNTSISFDKYYYVEKPHLMENWSQKMGCQKGPIDYPTDMDGIIGWNCKQWTKCYHPGTEIVHCTGDFTHNYPFFFRNPPFIEGTRIQWKFMKAHKRQA